LSTFKFFTIEKSHDSYLDKFLLLFAIARQHYVLARVAFRNGLADSGSLLAQQCIEAFLKSIMLLHWESFKHKDIWGHNIIGLLSRASRVVPELNEITKNPKARYFLDNLKEAYSSMRFGEAKTTVEEQEVIQVLDEIAFQLLKIYAEIITKKPLVKEKILYVPENLKNDFLCENKFFNETSITNQLLAIYVPPGIPLPELPKPN